VIACLVSRQVDPTRLGDMTFPMLKAILSDGKWSEKAQKEAHARKVVADFREGRLKWED
jgi:hypothetical protein